MDTKKIWPPLLFVILLVAVGATYYLDKHSSENEAYIKGVALVGDPHILEIGTQYSIEWDSSKDVKQVTIILEREGQFVKPALWIIENIKSAKWTPDRSLAPGTGYQIKVMDHGTGISAMSQVFAIEPYPCSS